MEEDDGSIVNDEEMSMFRSAISNDSRKLPFMIEDYYQHNRHTPDISDASDEDKISESANVIFPFEIGVLHHPRNAFTADDVETSSLCLTNKSVSLRAHTSLDAIFVDRLRIGNQSGGGNAGNSVKIERGDVLESLTVGPTTGSGIPPALQDVMVRKFVRGKPYGRFIKNASFRQDGWLEKMEDTRDVQFLRTEGRNNDNAAQSLTWSYQRQRLGLNLWITSAFTFRDSPAKELPNIFRLGFTLSSSPNLTFSPEAFEEFWSWLIRMKCLYESSECDYDLYKRNHEHEYLRHEEAMKVHKTFLMQAFSRPLRLCENPRRIRDGIFFIQGDDRYTNRFSYIAYDKYAVHVQAVANQRKFDTNVVLFVGGEQYDIRRRRYRNINIDDNNDSEQFFLHMLNDSLQDHDLLYEQSIVGVQEKGSRRTLRTMVDVPKYPSYGRTQETAKMLMFLAQVGLRSVAVEEVMTDDTPGWDIYCVAAARSSDIGTKMTAVFIATIQIVVPVLLIVSAYQEEDDKTTIFVYLVRILFAIYAILYENNVSKNALAERRLNFFLAQVPSFDRKWLFVGVLINNVARVLVSVAIFSLLVRSFSVVDVTLGALALYFIFEIDNYVVPDTVVREFQEAQKKELYRLRYAGLGTGSDFEGTTISFPPLARHGSIIRVAQWLSLAFLRTALVHIVLAPLLFGMNHSEYGNSVTGEPDSWWVLSLVVAVGIQWHILAPLAPTRIVKTFLGGRGKSNS